MCSWRLTKMEFATLYLQFVVNAITNPTLCTFAIVAIYTLATRGCISINRIGCRGLDLATETYTWIGDALHACEAHFCFSKSSDL